MALKPSLHVSCTTCICSRVSINVLDHLRSTLDQSWSILEQHLNRHSIECRPTYGWVSTNSYVSIDTWWFICKNYSTADRHVDRVSIKCRSSVNQVLIEGQSHQGLIDTQQWMTLVHMILLEVHNLLMKLVFIWTKHKWEVGFTWRNYRNRSLKRSVRIGCLLYKHFTHTNMFLIKRTIPIWTSNTHLLHLRK